MGKNIETYRNRKLKNKKYGKIIFHISNFVKKGPRVKKGTKKGPLLGVFGPKVP